LTTFGIYQGIKRMNSSNHQKTPTVLETRRNPQPGGTGTLSNPQGQGQPPVKVVGAPQGQPKVVEAPQVKVVEAPQVKVVEAPQVKVVEAPQVKVVEAPQPKPKDAQELLNDVETETETIKPTKKASQKEKNEDFAELMDESKLKMPQKTETTGSGAQPKPGVKATVNPQPNPTTTGSWETQLDKKTHELMKTQEQLNPTKMEATTGPGGGAPKPQSATAKEMEMEMETATAVKTVTTHPSATTPGPGPGSTTETHANSKGWSYIPFSGLLRDAQTLWRGEDASTKTDSKPHDHSANPAHTSTSHSEHKNSTHVVHDV
jgi:hypothetical protein